MRTVYVEIYVKDEQKLRDLCDYYHADIFATHDEPLVSYGLDHYKVTIEERVLDNFMNELYEIGLKYHRERIA